MSANPQDPWAAAREAHQKKIEAGEIHVITRQRGQGVIDPREQFKKCPEFTDAHLLPEIFNNYVTDAIASWGGDPGAYACSFIAMHVGVLHSSVKVNTNPLKPGNFRNPNDFSLTLGRSGANKSGMFKDLTRHQENWQRAMTRANARVTSARKQQPPMCFLQNASIEGMMMQIHDNRGDRLLMGSEEAMSFYDGAGLHHKDNATNAMSNAVCAVYDGGMFSKRLVTKAFSIPEALATLIMTTTIDKIVGWKAFKAMVESGLMARHTIGLLSHPREADKDMVIPGADEAMGDLLLKFRALRDIRLVLDAEAGWAWLGYRREREAQNVELVEDGAKEGFVNWMRKYDMRIMSAAVVLQLYEYFEGGAMAHEELEVPATEDDAGKTEGGTKIIKTIKITKPVLKRAIDFVEGHLAGMQEFFYNVAAGVTEFGMELMNFLSYRVTMDEPENPDCRIIAREMFTSKGPRCCRGAITPDLKETHKRWIQALLDHGFIERYEHPRGHESFKRRPDNEQPWYKVRDEIFEAFSSEDDRHWLKSHYEKSREIAGAPDVKRKRLSI